jgi:hypothetical protein
MSTVTQLKRYRGLVERDLSSQMAPNNRFRELWADSVATMSVVCLAAILIFETLRIVLQ